MDTRLPSASRIPGIKSPINVMQIGNPGMPGELIIHNGMLYLYSSTGETLIYGGIIYTGAILANSITTDKLVIGAQLFTHNITWTATDIDTCSWSVGTIKFADSSTISILSGNTGNIVATTYIYYNNSSTLATTTNYADVVGDNEILLAIVELGGTGGKCVITPINSVGTTIDGNKIVTGKIQSIDGKTYFDLNLGKFIVNDGSNDRVFIGKKP
jgi:hypothetical protein